jgi:hypothetical protein
MLHEKAGAPGARGAILRPRRMAVVIGRLSDAPRDPGRALRSVQYVVRGGSGSHQARETCSGTLPAREERSPTRAICSRARATAPPRVQSGLAARVKRSAARVEPSGGTCEVDPRRCKPVRGRCEADPRCVETAFRHVRSLGGACGALRRACGADRIGVRDAPHVPGNASHVDGSASRCS